MRRKRITLVCCASGFRPFLNETRIRNFLLDPQKYQSSFQSVLTDDIKRLILGWVTVCGQHSLPSLQGRRIEYRLFK